MAPVCDILLLYILCYQMNWDVLMCEFVGSFMTREHFFLFLCHLYPSL